MPETSTLIDLGEHALEISQDGGLLIASHPTVGKEAIETTQLGDKESWRLFIALQDYWRTEAQPAAEEAEPDDAPEEAGQSYWAERHAIERDWPIARPW